MLRHEVEAMIRQRSAQCATLLSTPRGRGANGLNPFLCAIMPWLQPQNGGGGGHSNPMCGVDKGLQQGMNEVGNVFQVRVSSSASNIVRLRALCCSSAHIDI